MATASNVHTLRETETETKSLSESESQSEDEVDAAGNSHLALRNIKNQSDLFVLDKNSTTFTLGKSKTRSGHFTIDSKKVATVHALLTLAGRSWVISKDSRLKSRYLLKVNENEVTSIKELEVDDVIFLGTEADGVRYRLERYEAPVDNAKPAAGVNGQQTKGLNESKYSNLNHGVVNGMFVNENGPVKITVNNKK